MENVEEIETCFCEDQLDQGIGYSFVYHNLPQPSMNGSESKKKNVLNFRTPIIS